MLETATDILHLVVVIAWPILVAILCREVILWLRLRRKMAGKIGGGDE